jgi:O-antigen/teichoic acid export membrane protein
VTAERAPAGPARPPNLILNILANFVGRGWSSLIGLIFVPIYIRFLGVEAYGLIGIYASLVALLSVLDMGLSSTLSRELARLSVMTGREQESRDLVRTMELIYWGIGLAVGCTILAAAPLIARHWVNPQRLSASTIQHAILIMGGVAAFEWPAALYTGGLMGLQRQVLLNVIRGVAGTVQAIGAVLILWRVSPTILAYFWWQIAVVVVQAVVLAVALWSSLEPAERPAAFSPDLLRKHWRFAAGMTAIAFLSTILTQLDKVVLTRLLPLEAFGYYALAFSIASATSMLVQPIFGAVFPRLAQVAAGNEVPAAAQLYHRSCQLVAVVVLPVAVTIAFFSHEVLLLWIRNATTAVATWRLLSVIVIGSALNSVAMMPYALQLAYGWTRLSVVKNIIAASFSVPLLIWLVLREGAMGGAIVWVMINAGYVLLEVPYMHRRLLRGEMKRWYLVDNLLPGVVILAAVTASRLLLPGWASGVHLLGWIVATWAVGAALAAGASGMLSPAALRTYVRSLTAG